MYCAQGTYHPVLVKSWRDYDNQFCSENSDPALLGATQYYVLLELEFGGTPLECAKMLIMQFESVFLQLACSLAVAEVELQFEHRDLHCGNVLVNTTQQEFAEFLLRGRRVQVRTAGVKASVIDFTLSRTLIGMDATAATLSERFYTGLIFAVPRCFRPKRPTSDLDFATACRVLPVLARP
ncbi:uncharacterized protein LOC125943339 [Dermacentor silvarum]|uniref:uncharacterized protein LOC125943339 n=1 Tax=Dermacentor silvarum TaxID=543639 RepID=UPI0021014183|nr:uncharacterized protein LOC125943339 [Dermacentor silvarum]